MCTSSIPKKVLKLMKTSLSEPISLIVNLSFETNTFPETLKQAKCNTTIQERQSHTMQQLVVHSTPLEHK